MTEKGTSIPIADPKNIKKFRVPVERFAWPDLCYSLSISLCLISAVDGMVCGCFAGELSRLMSSSSMGKRTHESSSTMYFDKWNQPWRRVCCYGCCCCCCWPRRNIIAISVEEGYATQCLLIGWMGRKRGRTQGRNFFKVLCSSMLTHSLHRLFVSSMMWSFDIIC